MKPPQPKNEKRRLEVLWQHEILDTTPEDSFDDLAELAAEICDAPIALITFVDEQRQWFKSRLGVNLTETPRDISFCAHAILGSHLLIVPDATKDQRFADNPLVTGEPKIRFYAGSPLIDSENLALGTICVLDKKPRELTPAQQNALRILSRHVMQLLTARRQIAGTRESETRHLVKGKYRKIFDNALVENDAHLPAIHADRGMMEQILLNLAVNSRDAMPRGGELLISTRAEKIDDTHTHQIPESYAGDFVCLTVRDTGCGIPPENLPHIFEPFFTTKEIGKGTGLGLATVYGIARQHEGWIEVSSELNKGTVFKIYFPQSHDTSENSRKFAQEQMPRGSETILVVEDEAPLRELVIFLLERQGYRVLEAHSGVAAVKVWEKHKDEIDLLLTDLVMPEGMTGADLSKRLLADDPELKVIFTSGYSADIVGKDFVLRDGINFLQKPYHPDKLTQTVRDCLDRE